MTTANDGTVKRYGLETGTVVRNDDPLKLGRVTFTIPGLVEPESDWAWPLGNPGGGGGADGARRGAYVPPSVGAEVGVLFKGGDTDAPYYLTGNYGLPDGKSEVPGPVGGYATPLYSGAPGTPEDISPEEAPLVKAFESDEWVVVVDDRPGKGSLKLENKISGDHILMLGKPRYGMELRVTGTLRLAAEGQLDLASNNLTFNGVPFLNDGKPR